MLDHMIFNRLKWFNISDNANEVAANNKIWLAVPNKLVLKAGSSVSFINDLNTMNTQDPKILDTVTVHCIGATKDAYFFDGNITWDDHNGDLGSIDLQEFPYSSNTIIGMVAKQEVQNVIWGGKNLLFTVMSMVEHAFAQFKKGAETC
ncbi:Uncharacterised protein [Lactobacillus acidophilus]|nr:Uncharacterised protein [Lactobacillus acidophilus]